MNLPIPILSVLIGAVILFFGRKLFWLCVAAVGFAILLLLVCLYWTYGYVRRRSKKRY